MARARVWPFTAFQKVDAALLSRVSFNGQPISQAGIAGITYTVKQFNDADAKIIVNPTALNVANCVFNAYQLDARWKKDTVGYNFMATIPGSAFPDPDEYWVVFVFTPTSGNPFIQINRGTVLSNLGGIP